jgi:hypothetical protein
MNNDIVFVKFPENLYHNLNYYPIKLSMIADDDSIKSSIQCQIDRLNCYNCEYYYFKFNQVFLFCGYYPHISGENLIINQEPM